MHAVAAFIVTVFLASTSVIGTSILSKPYYVLEDAENIFKDFLTQYTKSYESNEYLKRLEIFKDSLNEINLRNAKHPKTVFNVNHFTDLTHEERQKYRGFKLPKGKREKETIPDSLVPAPDKLNWKEKGLVTHVKDQGYCGSCFIFSAIGNIEGQYAMKHNKTLAFSEGQCLDCLKQMSCELGGAVEDVMMQLSQRAGLMLEKDYNYTDSIMPCKEDPKKVVAHVKRGGEIHIPDEATLKQKLADIGPLAVALNASDFDYYEAGVLQPDLCTGAEPDHALLLVGYDEEDDGTKFWILKNSWGTVWGEDGYVRLLRGVDACGMGTSYSATAEVE